jgi:hypothetical protein
MARAGRRSLGTLLTDYAGTMASSELKTYRLSSDGRSAPKRCEKNPNWKDGRSKNAIHTWVKLRLPRPELCQCCNKRKAVDLANISGEYKRDLNDWEYLCRHCHMRKDGRLEAFLGHKRSFKKGHKLLLGKKLVNGKFV